MAVIVSKSGSSSRPVLVAVRGSDGQFYQIAMPSHLASVGTLSDSQIITSAQAAVDRFLTAQANGEQVNPNAASAPRKLSESAIEALKNDPNVKNRDELNNLFSSPDPQTIPGTDLPATDQNLQAVSQAGVQERIRPDGVKEYVDKNGNVFSSFNDAVAATAAQMDANTNAAQPTPTRPESTINGQPVSQTIPQSGTGTVAGQTVSSGSPTNGNALPNNASATTTTTSETAGPNLVDLLKSAISSQTPTNSGGASQSGGGLAVGNGSSELSALLQFYGDLYPQFEDVINQSTNEAQQILSSGGTSAIDALLENYTLANQELQPYLIAGKQGVQNYTDLLGFNGADAQQAAITSIQADPGYQFRLEEGNREVKKQLSNLGLTEGTTLGRSLTEFGQNFATQEIQNRLANSLAIGQQGLQAASQASGQQSQLGQGLANTLRGLSSEQAGVSVTRGEGLANALAGISSNVSQALGVTPSSQINQALGGQKLADFLRF